MKKNGFLFLIVFVSFAGRGEPTAEELQEVRKIYTSGVVNCQQCHGPRGMGKAKVVDGKIKTAPMRGPQIAGLEESYIIQALKEVQGNDKKRKMAAMMRVKIRKLTPRQIEVIAHFVSKVLNPEVKSHRGMHQEVKEEKKGGEVKAPLAEPLKKSKEFQKKES